ncbi:MAG: hypothetical protein EOS28_31105 [Mesorhizobium sp.]|nr:MAG: hypothetical protein EOS28_31105 [Mesorhizobium sp.]
MAPMPHVTISGFGDKCSRPQRSPPQPLLGWGARLRLARDRFFARSGGFFDLDRRDKGRGLFRQVRRIVLKTCSLDHPAALAIYQKVGLRIVADVPMAMRFLTLGQRGAILLR